MAEMTHLGWGLIGASTIAAEHMIGAIRAQPTPGRPKAAETRSAGGTGTPVPGAHN